MNLRYLSVSLVTIGLQLFFYIAKTLGWRLLLLASERTSEAGDWAGRSDRPKVGHIAL